MKRFFLGFTLPLCLLLSVFSMQTDFRLLQAFGSNDRLIASNSNSWVPATDSNSSSPTPESPAPEEPVYVISSFFKQLFPHWKKVIEIEPGDSLTKEQFPSHILYMSNDGTIPLTIDWNLADEKLNEPGLHYASGTPILPSDTIFAEDFDGTALWPVFRSGEGAVLPVTPETPEIWDALIAQNGDPEAELRFYTPTSQYYIGNDGYVEASQAPVWTWDYGDIDVHTPGRYTVTGTPSFPEGYALADGYQAEFTVFVMPTDRIELYAPVELSGLGSRLHIEWIYQRGSSENPVLEHETSEGIWEPCDSSWYDFRPTSLILYPQVIPGDVPHTIRLRYPDIIAGETVERFTDPVTVTIPSNITELYEQLGSFDVADFINGDRDGSDSSENQLPDIEQPAPDGIPEPEPEDTAESLPRPKPEYEDTTEPDSELKSEDTSEPDPEPKSEDTTESDPEPKSEDTTEPDPEPEYEDTTKADSESEKTVRSEKPSDTKITSEADTNTAAEQVTDTYSAISGLRLNYLIDSGPTVLFEKHGVSAEIPSDLLRELKLGSSDLFEITLLHPQEHVVQISVIAAGIPLTKLDGTLLYIPWEANTGTETVTWECLNADGEYVSTATYHSDRKLLCLELAQPGTYFISKHASDQKDPEHDPAADIQATAETSGFPFVPLLPCLAIGLVLLIMIYRKARR